MKKHLFLVGLTICFIIKTNAQVSFSGTSGGAATDFVGWQSSEAFPLRIEHQGGFDIHFSTAGTQRMTIKGANNLGSWTDNTGWVGIGNNMPMTMLHLGESFCYSNNTCTGGTMLQGGWRNWMSIGTFDCFDTDNMYVGMKTETSNVGNRSDAVIAWGDDLHSEHGPDCLRFIFAEECEEDDANPIATLNDGAEVMRIQPWGNVGIGFDKFWNSGLGLIEPKAQLEVVEDSLQLRLSYDNSTANLVHTDITTTSAGDLYIYPTNNSTLHPSTRFVDIDGKARIRNLPSSSDVNVVVADATGKLFINTGIGGGITGSANAAWINTISGNIEWGTNPLYKDTEIPMNNSTDSWSIYFSGQSDKSNSGNPGSIGIGFNYTDPLDAKLDVVSETFSGDYDDYINPNAGKFYETGTYDYYSQIFSGVYGICDVRRSSLEQSLYANYGGRFEASMNERINIGVDGHAGITNASSGNPIAYNIGVNGYGRQDECRDGYSYGVKGTAYGGKYAFGVYGAASGGKGPGAPVAGSFGVYGTVAAPSLCHTNDYAGYFVGDVFSTTNNYLGSDIMLKENIEDVSPTSALEIIDQLQPKTYTFRTTEFPSMHLASGEHYGLIAQDVEQILPNFVKESVQPEVIDSLGNIVVPDVEFKALNYTEFIPILIASVKELKEQNEALAEQLQSLQDCCNQGNAAPQQGQGSNQRMIELDNYAIILDQNSPNPFAEKTTITYVVPADVKEAQIMFYDNGGRVLKAVQITERGAGSLLVYASNLSSGTYSYSLIADEKLIDTKKMVCQK